MCEAEHMGRTYWLDLFTAETWDEFRQHGGSVSGFSEARLPTVKKISPGDYLLCYLTRASRWVGVVEVIGTPFYDETRIWSSQVFPSRVPVRVVIALEPEFGVPVLDLREELSIFQGLENPNRWSGPFRGSPAKWKEPDGEAVLRALRDAQLNPVHRPLGKPRPEIPSPLSAVDEIGPTIPPDDESEGTTPEDGTTHTEIQYLLTRLGVDLGFDVHVARNDLNRTWKGQRLGDLPRLRDRLPAQFDAKTNQTIELIDVLWLQKNVYQAAFEIESTTSIYSGLLRMSDLVARVPNISVPLFLVAPEARRERVLVEVNRATFTVMSPPLYEVCRYISFENLREQIASASAFIKYMKADWLQTISDSCALEEAK